MVKNAKIKISFYWAKSQGLVGNIKIQLAYWVVQETKTKKLICSEKLCSPKYKFVYISLGYLPEQNTKNPYQLGVGVVEGAILGFVLNNSKIMPFKKICRLLKM